MTRLSKEALLEASDLVEREVELPSIGGSVKVRSLPASYSNQAAAEALVYKTVGREQVATVDQAKMEVIQALHGLVDPKLDTIEEAERFAKQCGPAFKRVIEVIDDISGVDKKAIEDAEVRFPVSRASESGPDLGNGASAGSSKPDVPARAGVGTGDAG